MDLPDRLRLDTCDKLIRNELNTLHPTALVSEALNSMRIKASSYCAIIDDDNQILGLITERDILDLAGKGKLNLSIPVQDIMKIYPSVKSKDNIASVVLQMYKSDYDTFPIIDNEKKIIGVVHARDFIHHLIDYFPETVYNVLPGQKLSTEKREGG